MPPVVTNRIGFLLLPQFSMLELIAAIEPLKYANNVLTADRYQWQLFTSDDGPVIASNGFAMTPTERFSVARSCDMLFVCSGDHITRFCDANVNQALQAMAARNIVLGALSTGAYLLARIGLLDGYRCSIHREYFNILRQEFPRVHVTNRLFELDRGRYTASGGTAPLDMLLHILKERHGTNISASVCGELLVDRIREADEQTCPERSLVASAPIYLREALILMDRNIEEPLLVSEIAHHVGVSKRQLERAFLTFLRRRPRELYLNIRLAKGRSMLRNSPLPIREIAFACGFSNSQHFSKSYRDHYECRPTDERNRSMLEHGRGALQDTRLGFGLNPQAMTW